MRFISYLLICFALPLIATADNYPKDHRIDILHYAFKISLSDSTDEIFSEASIDVKYLSTGVTVLRLDLIKAAGSLGNKGMIL